MLFQSTPLMRGETFVYARRYDKEIISIHSPHARGDILWVSPRNTLKISIHSPHARGDAIQVSIKHALSNFNPLPSCEGRRDVRSVPTVCRNFNPLPSCEGRHICKQQRCCVILFQSTPLMRGETRYLAIIAFGFLVFQSTPLMRGETFDRG